jgi:predicted transcriptional regulator
MQDNIVQGGAIMATKDQVTFRLKVIPKSDLEALAAADQRDVTSLLNKLIADYVEAKERAEITQRRDDAEAGRAKLISHRDAMAAWKPKSD